MQVHTAGKAVVASGSLEKSEHNVFQLQEHGLWATLQRDD
jgi:ATP-dependent Clp protease adaptor protein ClpS